MDLGTHLCSGRRIERAEVWVWLEEGPQSAEQGDRGEVDERLKRRIVGELDPRYKVMISTGAL